MNQPRSVNPLLERISTSMYGSPKSAGFPQERPENKLKLARWLSLPFHGKGQPITGSVIRKEVSVKLVSIVERLAVDVRDDVTGTQSQLPPRLPRPQHLYSRRLLRRRHPAEEGEPWDRSIHADRRTGKNLAPARDAVR